MNTMVFEFGNPPKEMYIIMMEYTTGDEKNIKIVKE